MAKQKFYVVWIGRQPGIYDNWDDCNAQVKGYSGAKFKSYKTRESAAEAFEQGAGKTEVPVPTIEDQEDVPWNNTPYPDCY